jgi:hypothetical protein
MRKVLTATLLSALVFPGLGQLYNQDRKKGIFLVLAANLLLGVLFLVSLILISREYTAVYYPRPLTWDILQILLRDTLWHPLFWLPAGLLLALWGYGAVDAGRHAHPPQETPS